MSGCGRGRLAHAFGALACFAAGGCHASAGVDTGDAVAPTAYDVAWSTEPAPPRAGEETRFTATVTDQAGTPIEDLQRSHARMLHTLFLSSDLRSFLHLHQEDFAPVTADDLRSATFAFPVTFPSAGGWRVVFDFAHRDVFLSDTDPLTVGGSPTQGAPDLALTDTATGGDVTGTLRFAQPPAAGIRSSWTVSLASGDGTPIDDVVPWLDTDAHAVLASADLGWVSHTHAWFPGMESMAPDHAMPHLYDGPDIPFEAVFAAPGPNVVWVQFARVDAPDAPVTLRFVVEVAP